MRDWEIRDRDREKREIQIIDREKIDPLTTLLKSLHRAKVAYCLEERQNELKARTWCKYLPIDNVEMNRTLKQPLEICSYI